MQKNLIMRLCYLTDVLGNTYVGFKIPLTEIQDVIEYWTNNFSSISSTTMSLMKSNRLSRDGELYHSTFLPVAEFSKDNMRQRVEKYIGINFNASILGIGRAYDEKKGNEAQFIVLNSLELNELRTKLNLEKRDMHITIGFDKKDVFSKPKDASSIYLK